MILFGWKTVPKIHGAVKTKCSGCKKKTAHGIITVTEWFTLYFIPIIPYNKKVLARCAGCFSDYEFQGEARKAMLHKISA